MDEHEELLRPRLLSVEIGDWPGLGGRVGFDLGERVTVLVGRNGAGKSLLVEGIMGAIKCLRSPGRSSAETPRFFRCHLALPGQKQLAYEYKWADFSKDIDSNAEDLDMSSPSQTHEWYERCWMPDSGEELWRVENTTFTEFGRAASPFIPGVGAIAMPNLLMANHAIAYTLKDFFFHFDMVRAGIPREGGQRKEIVVRGRVNRDGSRHWERERPGSHDTYLTWSIISMWDRYKDQYEVFVELLGQLGLVKSVKVEVYETSDAGQSTAERGVYAAVLLDGVNLGFCSDGTQRIADILRMIVRETAVCTIIEEPETAVHPSLLSRLLAIFESYSLDRQIVIATHSPQIVDWCKPKDLRLVERIDDKTVVSKLADDDLERVYRYLDHDGTFSDYIYNREDA